ncbi:uncharacterized protein L199_007254 [Kwoniella botswanensis]|uniref:uncharacterized protein n=1 Tax=Kwoniella botswanensis TaxID=1268659 RepID=UPI00315D85AE
MTYSKSISGLLLFLALGEVTMIQAAYNSLLFTEDFFPLINSRLDPIVNPGKVSGHVHHVVGGSAFSASMDYASARQSKCTSSNLNCDLSNYWTPQLYYKWRNGSYTAVTGDGMTNYWKYPLTNVDETTPFASIPDDFRMLAGDINRDDYDPNKAVSWLCVDAQYSYDYTDYIPMDRECLTLRPQLHFPECWNGVDSYKEDNSHVAYPIDANPEGGVCPDGFKKIPHLFMESTYHIKTENIGEGYEWYPGCFVLANGDNNGFSFHGDWLNGFPTNFLVDAFDQCYDEGVGEFIKDCPYITQFRGDIGRDCVTEGDVINELVGQHFAIPALPGNNPEYNSSKYSDNYPKGSIPGYTEQASIVKASDATGGFCVTGVCTDYVGGDVVVQDAAAPATTAGTGTGTGNSTAGMSSSITEVPDATASGPTTADSATAGTATGMSSSNSPTATTSDLGLDATMSILPISSIEPVDASESLPTLGAVETSAAPSLTTSHRWGGSRWSRRSGKRRL